MQFASAVLAKTQDTGRDRQRPTRVIRHTKKCTNAKHSCKTQEYLRVVMKGEG